MGSSIRRNLFFLFLITPMLSSAATSGFGSWFKRTIADPVTDASDVIYRAAANGVESVVDVASGAALYVYEKTSDGTSIISRKSSEFSMEVWAVTTDGLVYVGEKFRDGNNWIIGKLLNASMWWNVQFLENTEGTMSFNVPIALTRNGTSYLATQIFGLVDFNTARFKFDSFYFIQAYLDIPSTMGSGTISWWIECYSEEHCSKFYIMDNRPFLPGQRVATSASDWKSKINSMLDGDVAEAIMVFQINGYATSPEFVEIKFGFEAGMKGVK